MPSIVRADYLVKTGLSDPDFFMVKDMSNCHMRFKEIGGKLFVDLDQKISHSVSHTVGTNWAKTYLLQL